MPVHLAQIAIEIIQGTVVNTAVGRGTLWRYPSNPADTRTSSDEDVEDVLDQDDDELDVLQSTQEAHMQDQDHATPNSPQISRPSHNAQQPSTSSSQYALLQGGNEPGSSPLLSPDIEPLTQLPPRRKQWLVLPFYAVIASSTLGLLSLLDYLGGTVSTFNWLVSAASIASLQSWTGMLFTYIRFYQGTVYAEKKALREETEEDTEILASIKLIKKNRHPGQPWLAIYALTVCTLVLLTNGWAVFVANPWQIGQQIHVDEKANGRVTAPVNQFLASYIPIAIFCLLTFGYKLVHQTKMVPVEEMLFYRGHVPLYQEEPRSWWDKIADFLRSQIRRA
ncbi:hypothetical protein EIP86_009498 [Pleurotus ostreatoroseus]|nr:hypothetical protein EIP86_009498 [Pleurotus ostreatoroseus]